LVIALLESRFMNILFKICRYWFKSLRLIDRKYKQDQEGPRRGWAEEKARLSIHNGIACLETAC